MIKEIEFQSNSYSDEQINEYREVFSFFDRHNTGQININELGLIIRWIGFNPSEMIIKQFQYEYEQNQIDKIDFQQFLQILICFTNEIDDEIDIIEAFRVFDKEGQGMDVFIITIITIVSPWMIKKKRNIYLPFWVTSYLMINFIFILIIEISIIWIRFYN
jgi:Ca2+-binding EF-hand superfamily protein